MGAFEFCWNSQQAFGFFFIIELEPEWGVLLYFKRFKFSKYIFIF